MTKNDSKLENYLNEYGIESRDLEDKKYFSAIVDIAISRYNLPVADYITEEFGVNPSSLKRWIEGKAYPHPVTRRMIGDWILKRL